MINILAETNADINGDSEAEYITVISVKKLCKSVLLPKFSSLDYICF